MHIWIDADACPNATREVVFRAAQRLQLPVVLVANQPQRTPPQAWIRCVVVSQGFDEADHYMVEQAAPGDVAVTSDIPLAARLVEKGVSTLSPRGEEFTANSIGPKLSMRNFMDDMRGAYQLNTRNPSFSERDKQQFANALDRLLARARNRSG